MENSRDDFQGDHHVDSKLHVSMGVAVDDEIVANEGPFVHFESQAAPGRT